MRVPLSGKGWCGDEATRVFSHRDQTCCQGGEGMGVGKVKGTAWLSPETGQLGLLEELSVVGSIWRDGGGGQS